MKDITITEQALPVKSKNIDVVGEYTKSKPKNAANFVVIGLSTSCVLNTVGSTDMRRSC